MIVVVFISNGKFVYYNNTFPYIAGFLQFSIFAVAGEILSTRIFHKEWELSEATWFKFLYWGISGIFVTFAFRLFSEGVQAIMEESVNPFNGNSMGIAFITSFAVNIFFAPVHVISMRICGNYGDMIL